MELIDRSQSRDTPWDPLVQNTATMFGTRACEPHLGSGHVRPHQQTGHMAAIASIRNRIPPLASRGPSTYGSRLKAGTTVSYASPSVSNIAALMASAAVLPAQTTNWNAG